MGCECRMTRRGITGFAAAVHHRNWSHRGGLGNNLVMIGLSVRR